MRPLAPTDVLDIAIRAVTAYNREDLGERLRLRRDRIDRSDVRVLVVGEFKQGKSLLINALVNAPVCPVDDDVATAMPTEVRYAEEPELLLVSGSGSRAAPIDHIGRYVTDRGTENLLRVEAGIPRTVLAGGLCLVDTPGVGGLASAHGARTLSSLDSADAVIFVSDAAGEYTAAELDFLGQTVELCPNVLCVLTKTDLHRHWRRIAELDRARLRAAGIDAPLLPVSSVLREIAVREEDRGLNAESGFPALVRFLREDVLAQSARLTARSTAREVLSVTRQLTATMAAELAALRDPAAHAELRAELLGAAERVAELRARSARWQLTLNDGVADLAADVEHDLRDRMRAILREAKETLGEVDPVLVAEEFTAWLHRRVSAAATANFAWADRRIGWLAGQVAEHFAAAGTIELPGVRRHAPQAALARIEEFTMPEPERFGLGQKLITGMRGGYGGTLMVGMAGTLAGLTILNPVSITAGVLLGRKTVRDERKRMLHRRQQEAGSAARRYVDDVLFQLSKESRDLIRSAQRALRDHFTGTAEELSRSLAEAALAAEHALHGDESGRDRRIADLTAELDRVDRLAGIAAELGGSAGTPLAAPAPGDRPAIAAGAAT